MCLCLLQCLIDCRKEVAKALNLDEWELELSMGMSQDFEKAVSIYLTNNEICYKHTGYGFLKKKLLVLMSFDFVFRYIKG